MDLLFVAFGLDFTHAIAGKKLDHSASNHIKGTLLKPEPANSESKPGKSGFVGNEQNIYTHVRD